MDHILSDLSTMTHLSWVAPQAWLGFIELDKAVIIVRGQRRRPGGATLCPRSVVAGRRHPASEVRGGIQEELPHV